MTRLEALEKVAKLAEASIKEISESQFQEVRTVATVYLAALSDALASLASLTQADEGLTVGHVESAFRNGVKLGIAECVMDDAVAEVMAGLADEAGSLKHLEEAAFAEWQRQGGPCKPAAKAPKAEEVGE